IRHYDKPQLPWNYSCPAPAKSKKNKLIRDEKGAFEIVSVKLLRIRKALKANAFDLP
ncbi:hypothetical protein SAMN05444581_1191, partial [Methylocapsa palsarum]